MTPERSLDPELLLLVSARLSRWASRTSQLGMPVAAARLLGLIEELQPVRVSTLAQADQTSQPTMTTHVQRLEKLALVSRGPDAEDARVTLVRLTDQGVAMLADLRRRRAAVLTPYLDDMSEDERHRLLEATAALANLLRRIEHTVPTAHDLSLSRDARPTSRRTA
ncbi:MAG: MarR family winged helix-turn-helix transcriptional regulator [Dermatophilaceae bacterium]